MASQVLSASRAGIGSVVTTPTTTKAYAVPLNVVTTEAASGGSSGGTTGTTVRVMVLA